MARLSPPAFSGSWDSEEDGDRRPWGGGALLSCPALGASAAHLLASPPLRSWAPQAGMEAGRRQLGALPKTTPAKAQPGGSWGSPLLPHLWEEYLSHITIRDPEAQGGVGWGSYIQD